MLKNPLKVLAINPGSKHIGFAVFVGPELNNWGIKAAKGYWSREKLRRIGKLIENLVRYHQPDVLAVKKLHRSLSSVNLDRLISQIKQLSRRKGLRYRRYTIKEIESFFSPGKKINKKELARLVSLKYPALWHEFDRERSNKNPYHVRMFEAVALGAAAFHESDNY